MSPVCVGHVPGQEWWADTLCSSQGPGTLSVSGGDGLVARDLEAPPLPVPVPARPALPCPCTPGGSWAQAPSVQEEATCFLKPQPGAWLTPVCPHMDL